MAANPRHTPEWWNRQTQRPQKPPPPESGIRVQPSSPVLVMNSEQLRFWEKVRKSEGCWMWLACTDQDGYGRFTRSDGDMARAHRYSWEQFHNRRLQNDEVLRHQCDTPACVNPAHLTLGTHADNVADRVRKGRGASGVLNGRSKLNPALVAEIRHSTETHGSLARKYGVDPKTIRLVRQGKNWAHSRGENGQTQRA